MGVVIQATGVARPSRWPLSHGARRLADAATRRCLSTTASTARDIDVLVNVGVYRERGLGEPALAALIQDDVEANPGDVDGEGHGTFSFDIDNGACGLLTATDVIRGFLLSGTVESGLVVASDSGPDPMHARDLQHPEAGGALLLGRDDETDGLSATRLETFPEYAGLVEGHWVWREGRIGSGRNRLVVRERPGFIARAAECAAGTVTTTLSEEGLSPADVDLLIAAPDTKFADTVADLVGIGHDRVLHVGEQLGRMHTAAPIAAIDFARRTQRWSAAHTVLLVSAGAGVTVATAIYRH